MTRSPAAVTPSAPPGSSPRTAWHRYDNSVLGDGVDRVRKITKDGTPDGLKSVITSAGLVLAATFSVLTVIPVVASLQQGLLVAVGVLLDTFLVRSLLIPALALDIGPAIWWPTRLSRGAGPVGNVGIDLDPPYRSAL